MKKKNSKISKNNSCLVKKPNNKIKCRSKENSKEKHTLTISVENKNNKSIKNNVNIKENTKYNRTNTTNLKNLSSPNVKCQNKPNIRSIIANRKLIIESKFNYKDKNSQKYFNTIPYTQPSTKKNMFKIINKKINEEEKEKEKLTERVINNNNYDFNLYENLQSNIKNGKQLCKDEISKNSIYCLDCMLSSCPNCPSFSIHQNHNYIYTYNFYFNYNKKFEECFNDIDCLFSLNPFYLDVNKIKGELKIQVNNQINQIIDKLNEIKNNKLKEIDKLIDGSGNNVEFLKNKKKCIKNNIISLMDNQSYFLNFQNDINDNYNNDFYNTSFLVRYDLLKNTEYINERIKSIIMNIKTNSQKYLDGFNNTITNIINYINYLNEPFDGVFNYNNLNCELYKPIDEKLDMYSHKIELIKKNIFDKINKKGGLENIEITIKMLDDSFKNRYFNLLDFEVNNKNDINNKIKKSNNDMKDMQKNKTSELKINKKNNLEDNNKKKTKNSNNIEIFNSVEDVCLNIKILQTFYSYEILHAINNNNLNKHIQETTQNKTEGNEQKNEDYDKIQPIPGTNEIHIFNKKSGTIIKKFIKLNSLNLKYSYFLNGCRSILINDLLYILGGVVKEKIESKLALVYSIKTNEISLLPEMLKPHSYHSLYYIDNYNSILVIGGENNSSCELFQRNTNTWVNLPDMNFPKANCNIYYDKNNDYIYTFFGKAGKITEKNNYLDIIEYLDLRQFPLEWKKIKYHNKAEINVKNEYIKISPSPILDDAILINGGKNERAVYLINKKEIVKFDYKIYNQIFNNVNISIEKIN